MDLQSEHMIEGTFDFATEKLIDLQFQFNDDQGIPHKNVVMSLWTALPENNGKKVLTFATDQRGSYSGKIRIPSHLQNIILITNYIGLPNFLELPVNKNIRLDCNGSVTVQGYKTTHIPLPKNTDIPRISAGPSLGFLGTFNSQGVPNYLESTNDYISSSFLSKLNASLPESHPVPTYHPDYLDTNKLTDLIINQLSDVWVTFVHEGAGYKNVLCYYAYNKNNPPQSTNDIDSLTVIFPNVSYSGSGGGLSSGNKVKIGRFGADTIIGFALIANGYYGSGFSAGAGTYYSDMHLNPENTTAKRQHHVLLFDSDNDRMLFAFEDLNRQSGGSDDDFNDAVFYATTNPVNAYQTSNVNAMDIVTDSDNDGISDLYDDYPQDASRAFDNFYPYSGGFATLAFEDLWPGRGDYDMNDLNIGYQYNLVCNPQNKVIEIKSKHFVRCAGAGFTNALGFEIPVDPNIVLSVSGNRLYQNYLNISSNGTESGQTNAVIFVFDDQYNLISRVPGHFINTEPGQSLKTGDTVNLLISLNTPQVMSDLGAAPFNPFIVVNKERGKEVHLPNHPPTNKANTQLFGSSHDRSNLQTGIYYLTDDGMPWAINIPEIFNQPSEKNSIRDAYLHFNSWASSHGQQYADWYLNLNGYRNSSKIY